MTMTMTIEPPSFPNGQKTILIMTTIPFYREMVMVKWSKLTDKIFQQFQQVQQQNNLEM